MGECIYDIIGIGVGPFNLGLAAILDDIPELTSLFFDRRPAFNWHPGLLLPGARMQVPYYADLVTIVNPQSRFTFHKFLHDHKRFFRFANQENNYPLRKEYNEYCQWVVAQLSNLNFNNDCKAITYDETKKTYKVQTNRGLFHAKHIVLGTGTEPFVPTALQELKSENVIHSGQYVFNKPKLLAKRSITILGSGQSAAEIFLDLLPFGDEMESLSWFTRSNRFHPMEVSRFTTEMTSLDYIDHFYGLATNIKERVLQDQHYLYKGINSLLIEQINEALYIRFINGNMQNIQLQANQELINAIIGSDNTIALQFKHRDSEHVKKHDTEAIVAATGYCYRRPECIAPLTKYIQRDERQFRINRDYSIDARHTIFVQNTDLHTHGFNSADLGMGPYRNATIVNSVLGVERFVLEKNTAFQKFG